MTLLCLLISALGFSAVQVRKVFLPAWQGAPAYLVDIILALSLLILSAEAFGLVGLLYGWLLVLTAVAIAGATTRLRPDPRQESAVLTPDGAESPWLKALALAIVLVVFAHWAVEVHGSLSAGISNFDSLWHHLPFAATVAQTHSVTPLVYNGTVFTNLNWFYPWNSELLHALGMDLLGRDTLSLFLNSAWLLLAFLAAWSIGSPSGRGSLSVICVAIVLDCEALLVRNAGTAKSDLMAAALFLAAVAIIANAWRKDRDGLFAGGRPLVISGLAIGLALGTKVTVLFLVLAFIALVIHLAPAAQRRSTVLRLVVPAAVVGGLWYLRNLIVVGNPLPQVSELGPLTLPHPEQVQHEWPHFSILHYATDFNVWRNFFEPGLKAAFGPLWFVLSAAILVVGLLLASKGRDPLQKGLGVVVLIGLFAYLATPLGAGGPEGQPINFWLNVRYVIPTALLGLAVLPLLPWFEDRRLQWGLAVSALIVLAITDRPDGIFNSGEAWVFALTFTALIVAVPAAMMYFWRRGGSSNGLAGEVALLVAFILVLGYPVQKYYLDHRFGPDSGIPGYGVSGAYQWADEVSNARIGLAGTTTGFMPYGFYGEDLSNEVEYLGARGPKGAFNPITDCRAFRRKVNEEEVDFLVSAPFLNFLNAGEPIFSPEAQWLKGDGAARPLQEEYGVTIWEIRGPLTPSGCDARENAPLHYMPEQPF